ncbi:MAG: hypothetical protein ABIU77_02770 [Ferruginibacter sp.]
MIDYYETKEHPITKKMMLDASKEIKAMGMPLVLMVSALEDYAHSYREISINYGTE